MTSSRAKRNKASKARAAKKRQLAFEESVSMNGLEIAGGRRAKRAASSSRPSHSPPRKSPTSGSKQSTTNVIQAHKTHARASSSSSRDHKFNNAASSPGVSVTRKDAHGATPRIDRCDGVPVSEPQPRPDQSKINEEARAKASEAGLSLLKLQTDFPAVLSEEHLTECQCLAKMGVTLMHVLTATQWLHEADYPLQELLAFNIQGDMAVSDKKDRPKRKPQMPLKYLFTLFETAIEEDVTRLLNSDKSFADWWRELVTCKIETKAAQAHVQDLWRVPSLRPFAESILKPLWATRWTGSAEDFATAAVIKECISSNRTAARQLYRSLVSASYSSGRLTASEVTIQHYMLKEAFRDDIDLLRACSPSGYYAHNQLQYSLEDRLRQQSRTIAQPNARSHRSGHTPGKPSDPRATASTAPLTQEVHRNRQFQEQQIINARRHGHDISTPGGSRYSPPNVGTPAPRTPAASSPSSRAAVAAAPSYAAVAQQGSAASQWEVQHGDSDRVRDINAAAGVYVSQQPFMVMQNGAPVHGPPAYHLQTLPQTSHTVQHTGQIGTHFAGDQYTAAGIPRPIPAHSPRAPIPNDGYANVPPPRPAESAPTPSSELTSGHYGAAMRNHEASSAKPAQTTASLPDRAVSPSQQSPASPLMEPRNPPGLGAAHHCEAVATDAEIDAELEAIDLEEPSGFDSDDYRSASSGNDSLSGSDSEAADGHLQRSDSTDSLGAHSTGSEDEDEKSRPPCDAAAEHVAAMPPSPRDSAELAREVMEKSRQRAAERVREAYHQDLMTEAEQDAERELQRKEEAEVALNQEHALCEAERAERHRAHAAKEAALKQPMAAEARYRETSRNAAEQLGSLGYPEFTRDDHLLGEYDWSQHKAAVSGHGRRTRPATHMQSTTASAKKPTIFQRVVHYFQ